MEKPEMMWMGVIYELVKKAKKETRPSYKTKS